MFTSTLEQNYRTETRRSEKTQKVVFKTQINSNVLES